MNQPIKGYTDMEEDKKSIDYSVTKDGVTKSFRIREAIGGWIVNCSKEWQEDDEWKYESKEYVTTTDPSEFIKKKEDKMSDNDMISGMFESLLST